MILKLSSKNIYRTVEDDHTLLVQLTQMKKEIHEPMREFMAKYNKLIPKIPVAKRPNDENQKTFFLNAMPLDIGFHLRRSPIADLIVAQNRAISLEDDLIITGKWRKDVQTPNMQPSTSSDPVIQCLMNDVISLKR